MINPELEPIGDASAAFFEGCLSVAGYRAVVRRHLKVRCRGLGGDGAPVDFVAEGWQARILQHEVDHLNGVLYTDRMENRTFRRVDMLEEALPGDHPEFGRAVVLGESNEPVVRGRLRRRGRRGASSRAGEIAGDRPRAPASSSIISFIHSYNSVCQYIQNRAVDANARIWNVSARFGRNLSIHSTPTLRRARRRRRRRRRRRSRSRERDAPDRSNDRESFAPRAPNVGASRNGSRAGISDLARRRGRSRATLERRETDARRTRDGRGRRARARVPGGGSRCGA